MKHSRKTSLADPHVARRGVLGFGERHRRGRLGVDGRGPRLGDDRVPVEQHGGAVRLGAPASGRSSGGGQPKRDLDLVRVDERREPARRVAAVRRRERPAEAAGNGDLHRRVG